MEQGLLDNIVLALLFASDEPLFAKRVSMVLDDLSLDEIRESIARLENRFGGEDSAIRIEQVAGGYQLCTSPRYADFVARLYRGRRKQRLSKASMETLAIIAYRQPVTRADVENLRGVACGGVITTLMERSLIRIEGKARVLGSPFLYGTTQEFLEYLGLNSLKDLPSMEDLEALLEREAASEPADDAGEPGGGAVGEAAAIGTEDESSSYGVESGESKETGDSSAEAAGQDEDDAAAGAAGGDAPARDEG
jgi:segregation and condensation protein B